MSGPSGGPMWRPGSPSPGCSTLITSAPWSASVMVRYGPGRNDERSMTRRPSSFMTRRTVIVGVSAGLRFAQQRVVVRAERRRRDLLGPLAVDLDRVAEHAEIRAVRGRHVAHHAGPARKLGVERLVHLVAPARPAAGRRTPRSTRASGACAARRPASAVSASRFCRRNARRRKARVRLQVRPAKRVRPNCSRTCRSCT